MKEWKNGSPSQISAFTRCQRRWFFGSRMGIEQPQGEAAAIGEEGHNRTQSYLVAGADPGNDDLADVVRTGLLFLPPPRTVSSEQVEKWIRLNAKDHTLPVDVVGQLDFEEPAEDRITDFKFRGRKASCTKPAHLYDDPQAVFYSYEYLVRRSPLGPIRFRHLNFIREGGPAVPVEITYSEHSDLAERFDRVIRTPMWQMSEAGKVEKVSDLPPNKEACRDYGGCPFLGICMASEVQVQVQPPQGAFTMASLADLFKTPSSPAPAAAPAPAPAAPAAFVQPTPFVVPGAVVSHPAAPNPPDAPVMEAKPAVEATEAPAKKNGRKEKSVTLLDGREVSGKANLALERGTLHASIRKDASKWASYQKQSDFSEVAGTSMTVEALAQDLKLLDEIASQNDVSTCVPVVVSASIVPDAEVRVLCVNGTMRNHDAVWFDEFIKHYADIVCAKNNVGYLGEVDYNKGPTLAIAELTADLASRGPLAVLPARMVVDRSHPCAREALPVLRVAYAGIGAIVFDSWSL